VSLGCGTGVVVLFLLQTITDEVIESGTGVGIHMLHHLWIESSLETGNSFSISVNHIGGITAQVVEGMQILHHSFGALIQCQELFQLHLGQPRWNTNSTKGLSELSPRNMSIWRESGVMVLLPHSRWPLQLMCNIFGLQYLSQPQHTEFIFHSVDLFFSIEWFYCFLEYWRPGVHKILEVVVLIHPIATTLIVTALNIVGNGTQKILHVLLKLFSVALTPEQLCKEHLWSEQGRRWQMWFRVGLIVVDVVSTTTTCPSTITTCLSGLISGTSSICHLHISATSND
jgi:hypothetical protein